MKTNLFIKAVCLSVLSFLLAYGCYHFSKDIFEARHSEFWSTTAIKIKTNYRTFEEKVSFENVDAVVVEAVSTDLELDATQGKEGKISLTTGMDSNQAFRAVKEGHKLLIQLADLSPYNLSTLTLKLPASVKTIEVKNSAGDVHVNQLELDQLVVTNSHGDIKFDGGSAKQARLQTAHGSIRSDANISKLQAKSVFGDIVISILTPAPQYHIETVSGDITLIAHHDLNAKLDLHSVNGTVSPESGSVQAKTTENQGYISAKTVNGDVNLENH